MELVNQFKISEEDASLIIAAVANGAVNLLLGAGGSYGAIGGDGIELKGGADLANELNENFNLGLDDTERWNLPLVYGDIESSSKSKATLNHFLSKRFVGCRPTWQSVLHDLPWKRIWTLNIDDVLDKSKSRGSLPKLESHLWCEPYKPRPLAKGDLQAVYLHGKASKLSEKPDHLIFSLKEYVSRNENTPGWHAEFRSEWVKKPFIVCGARLQEEVDLITVLEFGNRSRERGGCPSIVVLSSMNTGQITRFERQGLIPVVAKGKDFFEALLKDLAEWKKQHPEVSKELAAAREEVRAKFKQLTLNVIPPRKPLDFYASAETQWIHILQDLDAPSVAAMQSAQLLSEISARAIVRAALIYGGSVSGKSAAALRVGRELIEQGYEVWSFRGEERFNESDIVEYAQLNKVAFIFDDCADFSSSLKTSINLAISNGCDLRLVVTCDAHRVRAVRADLAGAEYQEFHLSPLDKKDFNSIFTKRSNKGRLGTRSSLTPNQAWKEFKKTYDCQLLEWLESLENAHSYRAAIVQLLANPDSVPHGTIPLIVSAAAVHRFGYSLPYDFANGFLGKNEIESVFDQDSILGEIGYLDDKGLRLRSSAFSQFVWSQIGREERFSLSLKIARALAPLVVPQSIARRTQPYLIIRALMDHETIQKDLGADADSWYANLENSCGWNARYWEQRALLASNNDQEGLAYSYAKKAVSILEHDPFPHTTLGKVCVKIGVNRKDSVGVQRFWEGVDELKASRDLSTQSGLEWEHPYVTFFTYALRAIKLPHFNKEIEKLSIQWKAWMKAALNSEALIFDEQGKSSLEAYQRRWIMSAVSG